MHALDEILVREIPVLEDDAVAGVFQDFADDGSKASIRARPRDEKMDFVFRCCSRLRHRDTSATVRCVTLARCP
jgi:hypothetical protein